MRDVSDMAVNVARVLASGKTISVVSWGIHIAITM